jgi:predicted nucleotidyltransferase
MSEEMQLGKVFGDHHMAAITAEVERRARAAAQALGRQGVVRALYVFGSQVNGQADRWSDIDLAAFMDGVESWDLWRRTRVIVDVQREAGYDIEPHLFSAALLTGAGVQLHGVRVL